MTGHVMADVLGARDVPPLLDVGASCHGLEVSSRRRLACVAAAATIGFAALSYLARPEGLLLPMALVACLAAMPLLRSTRMLWPRWWAAVGFLVIGPALLVGPYIAMKGGLGTKPAIARLLGTAPKSAPTAVERQRPLDPDQSTATTYLLATRAMAEAVRDSVTIPLLPFVVVGFALAWPPGVKARSWLLVTIILVATALALIRLHATGGYCTPRHAMVMAYLLIPAAASGLLGLVSRMTIPGRWVGLDDVPYKPGPAVWLVLLGGLVAFHRSELFAPINEPMAGYRDAGRWIAEHTKPDDKVADVTGLSLFYGERTGYTFRNIIDAPNDPALRYVVVREAHLKGPWPYCEQIRAVVGDLKPVATYPENPRKRQAKVFVFERPAAVASGNGPTAR